MMSSKKPSAGGGKPKSPAHQQQHAGQKRPASSGPSTPRTPAAAAASNGSAHASSTAKKQKVSAARSPAATNSAPHRPSFGLRADGGGESDSDDDAAIQRLKAGLAQRPVSAAAAIADEDDDGFEVAAGSGDDDDAEPQARAMPSDIDDDDEDNDASMEDAEPAAPRQPKAAAPTAAPKTPVAASKPAAAKAATPVTPAAAADATPAKHSPALKAASTPKPAAAAAITPKPTPQTKKATPAPTPAAAKQLDSSSESSEDDQPGSAPSTPAVVLKAKTAAATSAAQSAAKKSAPTPSAAATPTSASASSTPRPAVKPEFKVVAGDSSESSDDDEAAAAVPAVPAYKKPQPARTPTPLKGDASVNPPPRTPKTPKVTPAAAAAAAAASSSSSFVHPLTRPEKGEHTGRKFTVSIALPGSIISNAQSRELRTYVAGQIARAAATFNVDEIVVFAESGKQQSTSSTSGHFEGATRSTDPDVFLARILQYLETPQYLRKQLFPKHVDLAAAGLLNPLDSPHHVRADEESAYREGVVVNRPVSARKGEDDSAAPVTGCWVNIGLKNEAFVPSSIEPGTRVTVHVPQVVGSTSRKSVGGRAVASSTPREKHGTYWGYTTRLAASLGDVWKNCPYPGGYDLSIGTSERGKDIHAPSFGLPPFKHMIIFFGGLAGLEDLIESDETLSSRGKAEDLFNMYVNCVVGQGCRTIRTEEAIPITLAAMYRHVRQNQPPEAGAPAAATAE